MTPREAIVIAQSKSRDLIEVVPNANPPVCKVMDFGKYKYELQKKEKIQKKHQHVTLVKELRFHPNTDVHDFEFKAKHALQFLADGHKVKATVIFKGREITYKEKGEEVLNRLIERLSQVAKIDQPAHMEGRALIIFFAPDKTAKSKSETKTTDKSKNTQKVSHAKDENAPRSPEDVQANGVREN
jgi:translation initiation factor IF-3